MKSVERRVVMVLAGIQFANVVDFMMVQPLGPLFARTLGIPASNIGVIAGSYTAAAALAGIIGSTFLDRFEKKRTLVVACIGLAIGTLLGALATTFSELIAARILAGAFGGPATSISLALMTDAVPAERRGRALGTFMSAFSVASVVGVPAGLWLSELGGYRLPFLAVGCLCLMGALLVALFLPSPARPAPALGASEHVRVRGLLSRPLVLVAYSMAACAMTSGFLVFPNIPAFLEYNVGFPRTQFWMLYLAGGISTLVAMPLIGRLVDRFGGAYVGSFGSIMVFLVIAGTFVADPPLLTPFLLFITLMVAMSFRNLSMTSLSTRVPSADERSGYMSMQSAIQHISGALGSFGGASLLVDLPNGHIGRLWLVGTIALTVNLCLIPLFFYVERKLKRTT